MLASEPAGQAAQEQMTLPVKRMVPPTRCGGGSNMGFDTNGDCEDISTAHVAQLWVSDPASIRTALSTAHVAQQQMMFPLSRLNDVAHRAGSSITDKVVLKFCCCIAIALMAQKQTRPSFGSSVTILRAGGLSIRLGSRQCAQRDCRCAGGSISELDQGFLAIIASAAKAAHVQRPISVWWRFSLPPGRWFTDTWLAVVR